MGNQTSTSCINALSLSNLTLKESTAKRGDVTSDSDEKRVLSFGLGLNLSGSDERTADKETPVFVTIEVKIVGHLKQDEEKQFFEIVSSMVGEFSVNNDEVYCFDDINDTLPTLANFVYGGLREHLQSTIVKMGYQHSLVPMSLPTMLTLKTEGKEDKEELT